MIEFPPLSSIFSPFTPENSLNWDSRLTLTTVTIIMDTMYELLFTDTAKAQYEKLDSRLRRQVDKGLERISANPKMGKPLRGELRGIFSERVATFRILYKIRKTEIQVLVLIIEHRKSVYGGH